VIVEAPIISMEYNTMARHTSHGYGRPLKSKTDHQNSPRPKRALAPGAAQSAQQPTDTGHQNPQKSTFDLDAEMGLPRGNNFHLPREAQRVLTGYSSFTSSDTTDDGIQLLRASEIEREHQRFESNFAVSIYDEQPKEDRDSDALVAYAVEIPALGGQESLETDDVPINYGDSSSDHIFKTKSTRNRKRCYLVVVFAVVVAAAMATAGYIFKTRKSHSKTPPLSTANATSSPTTGPTMSTYGLKALILTYLPDTARSLEKDTPQHDAFTWLESATNDAYKGDSRRMLQRYALAVFFYSTGGPQWLKRSGWTTSDDECTWEFTSTTYPCNTDGNIIWIDMRQNSLIGELPVEVSMLLPFIRGIDLSGNQLAEAFPTHLQSLVGLEYYFVEANHVTGILPSEIGLLTNIQYLSLSQNRLSGTIPSVIGRLTNLRYLSLATNSLTGTLPTEVGLLRNIETVDLERNELRGTIPSQFHLLPGLNDLALSINFFTGRIPSEFGNLIGLTSLTMDLNDLIGPVPSELGRLTTLRTLWLQQNSLTGTIPPEIGSIGSLVWLDMSDNLLQGSLPEEIGDLTNLEVVKLNENDLEQAIPASFGKCKRLAHLMLYGNRLNGTIPSGFGDLFLDILDLRDNNLTGSLPADLVDGVAADAFLDVSGNLLTGTVPYLICEKLAIGNGELKVDCGELLCDASCCPSCAFQVAAFDVFGG
jgi:Leucine-rich repeat (LRR) protein